MREQTQYTTMVPNYQIITSQPTCRPLFTLHERSARPRGPPHQQLRTSQPQRTGPCRPYNVPQQLLRSPRLKVENQDEGGGGGGGIDFPPAGTTGYPLPAHCAAARPLSDRGGGESSFPHQGTPCQRTALSHTRVPLASAQRARHPPDGARYGAAPAYSARYGAPSAYSADRSAPSTSASSAMRTYMPFSISIK